MMKPPKTDINDLILLGVCLIGAGWIGGFFYLLYLVIQCGCL